MRFNESSPAENQTRTSSRRNTVGGAKRQSPSGATGNVESYATVSASPSPQTCYILEHVCKK